MKRQKCFSGNDHWTQEWQNKMNEMGHQASLRVIHEYPDLELIEKPLNQSGYDVTTRKYDIKIETKRRDRTNKVDITKTQSEKSDIITAYLDKNWDGYHCLTEKYNELAEITSYYKKNKKGKYLWMSSYKFKEIATKDLRELVKPLISVSVERQTLDEWFQ
jgi:hypothetical protein